MNLIIQIQTLVFSFVYGMFFQYTVCLNYKYLVKSNTYVKILVNFLFVIDHVLLYFFLLLKINNGILHLYFFISFLLGIVFLEKFILRK